MACAPADPSADDVDLTVSEAAGAKLSSKSGDVLFTLAIAKAPKSYALNDITVSAQLPGQTAFALELEQNDARERLARFRRVARHERASGEPLRREPAWRGDHVSFAVREGGTLMQRGEATWTP